jgi:hypothetical protein
MATIVVVYNDFCGCLYYEKGLFIMGFVDVHIRTVVVYIKGVWTSIFWADCGRL